MMTDEISEFLEKIDSEHFNCVYSCNGMTLLRTEEYSNRLEEIAELKREVNKYKQHEACNMISGVPSEQTNEHLVVEQQSTKSIKTFKDFLFNMIKATVRQEEHLGDNLKRQCLEYLDELKNKEMEEK